jgi:hypothetical protein
MTDAFTCRAAGTNDQTDILEVLEHDEISFDSLSF